MKVRDYECDIQGIVNNSVYQNYLEHARHEYLSSAGIDFHTAAKNGFNLVVTRAELDYKAPLKSGDNFWVDVTFTRPSRIRFEFQQNIYRAKDQKLVLSAKVMGACINEKGRPCVYSGLDIIAIV